MTGSHDRTIEPVRERVFGPSLGTPRLHVRVASSLGDVIRCQRLIADVYNRHYDIVFTRHAADLSAKVEPYPDRFAMGEVDGQLVAACGLYVRRTYVEAFGKVSKEDIRRVLRESDLSDQYPHYETREYTKLVVHPDWHGRGIGRLFFAMSHSQDFLNPERDPHTLVTCCAKRSVFDGLYEPVGVRSRLIKPFPVYRVHELYSSPDDPMESRLIVPKQDIEQRWYGLQLPGAMVVDGRTGVRQ